MASWILGLLLLLVVAPATGQMCPGDNNRDAMTTVDEIVAAVNSALNGCDDRARFVDNGDGTISDYETRLMWEKKSDDGSIHDKDDDQYTWSKPGSFDFDGTAYTTFLATLNGEGGFAGHTDWRLPTLGEYLSLVDYADALNPKLDLLFEVPCPPSCTVTTCSCIRVGYYWSSTTIALNYGKAVAVYWNGGALDDVNKPDSGVYVRAVRTGL